VPGWTEDLSTIRRWSDLPPQARDYVELLGELAGVPVTIVSIGPERLQTIFLPGMNNTLHA